MLYNMEKQEEIGALYAGLAKDVSYRNKVVVYIGKDFHEFGCTEEQARELLRAVMEYLGKPGK